MAIVRRFDCNFINFYENQPSLKNFFFLQTGLTNGQECVCFEALPFEGITVAREEDHCVVPCTGDQKYLCGGNSSLSIYIASKVIFASLCA